MTHELKTWPEHFKDVIGGSKTFEVRKHDRDYQVGDVLHLLEWDNERQYYTGRDVYVRVSHVLKDAASFGLMDGYCIMSIRH